MPTASPSAMSLPPSYHCHVCLQPPFCNVPAPILPLSCRPTDSPSAMSLHPILPLQCRPTASPSAMSLPPSYRCHVCIQPPLLQCPCPHLTAVMYAYSLPFCNVPAPVLPLSCMPTASPSAMSLHPIPPLSCRPTATPSAMSLPQSYRCHVCLQPPLLECPCSHRTTVM